MKQRNRDKENCPSFQVCLTCNKCVLGSLSSDKHEDCRISSWAVCWQCGLVRRSDFGSRSHHVSAHRGHQQLPSGDVGMKNFRRVVMQKARKEGEREASANKALSQVINSVIRTRSSSESSSEEFAAPPVQRPAAAQREEEAAVSSIQPAPAGKRMELYSPMLEEEASDEELASSQQEGGKGLQDVGVEATDPAAAAPTLPAPAAATLECSAGFSAQDVHNVDTLECLQNLLRSDDLLAAIDVPAAVGPGATAPPAPTAEVVGGPLQLVLPPVSGRGYEIVFETNKIAFLPL